MTIPRIAITPGEPAGIGPDVVIAALQKKWSAELIIIGDASLFAERAGQLGLKIEPKAFNSNLKPTTHLPGQPKIVNIKLAERVIPGVPSVGNVPAVLDSLAVAAQGCLEHTFDAMVTAPIQKSIINDSGTHFSGHTEFLAGVTNTTDVVMMLTSGKLRIALATTHIPLSQVPASITKARLVKCLEIIDSDLRTKFGISKPRITVLGLNPHAGEVGHLGREEIDVISPSIAACQERGFRLLGPLPADTAFSQDSIASCDAFLSMYHDQGLPVLKYKGFGDSVNVTLGLPIIRTSVDHGTALDLAASGRAYAGSLEAAIDMAIDCAQGRAT